MYFIRAYQKWGIWLTKMVYGWLFKFWIPNFYIKIKIKGGESK